MKMGIRWMRGFAFTRIIGNEDRMIASLNKLDRERRKELGCKYLIVVKDAGPMTSGRRCNSIKEAEQVIKREWRGHFCQQRGDRYAKVEVANS